MKWTWDRESSCWLCGTPENGTGVGTCRNGYDGVVTLDGEMKRIGVCDSLEGIQEWAEQLLAEHAPKEAARADAR